MKRPLTVPDEPQPRNITRADLVMTEGFGLQVDGRMMTVFPTLEAAQKGRGISKPSFRCSKSRYTTLRKRNFWNCRRLSDAMRPLKFAIEANVVGFSLRNVKMRPWQ